MCEPGVTTKQVIEVGIGRTVNLPFGVALEKIELALQKEGFGVLTRIDVKDTLARKIGVERTPFVILGACHPVLAHQALEIEPQVGLLLPCNVVVREVAPGQTRVETINPDAMMGLFPEADLHGVAQEARQRLERAVASFDAAVPS